MSVGGSVSKRLAPRITQIAPEMTNNFVREALNRAIHGVGPLPAAAVSARKQLADEQGNVDEAIQGVIQLHVQYAGAQGFLTNLGGLVTAVVAVPANITGLALI